MNEMFVYPVINMRKTGENIRALREKNGMSAKDLGEILGFSSAQAVYKWQWGQTLPDLSNLLIMAKLWDVSVEDILVVDHRDVSFFYHEQDRISLLNELSAIQAIADRAL